MSQPANTLPIRIAPLETQSDKMYARATWIDAYRFSCRRFSKMRAGDFRRSMVGRQIGAIIAAPETLMLGAFLPSGALAGWLACVPGSRISTVHYAYTRKRHGDHECRRQGVMSSLLDAAELGSRIAYTHRGERKKRGRGAGVFEVSDESPTLDLAIVQWMKERGVSANYVEIDEWLK